MLARQLIEALMQMPPDAEVIVHSNNHVTGGGDTLRVGLLGLSKDPAQVFVCIGNWDEHYLPNGSKHSIYVVVGRTFRVHGSRWTNIFSDWTSELTEENFCNVKVKK